MHRHVIIVTTALLVSTGCADSSERGSTDSTTDATPGTSAETSADTAAETTADASVVTCPLGASTTATATTNEAGCAVLERDSSACRAGREAAGLSGFWLEFSCRVTLSKATAGGIEVVRTEADGQPDYPSFYFQADHACYEDWPDGDANPNHIVATTRVIDIPVAGTVGEQTMTGGIVGVAMNGVPIFGDFAAPGDDIFLEVFTFDRCGAHPSENGTYHYHGEPWAISNDDARFIGVLRDGYPIYGRRDADGTTPTLDVYGGHTSVTAHSPGTPVYHYHLNEQTSTAPLTAGDTQWFLTTGTYRGTPAACADCR